MLSLILPILGIILGIIFLILYNYSDFSFRIGEFLEFIGTCLLIIGGIILVLELIFLMLKPIVYEDFKAEYEVVKNTITSEDDIRDTNITQRMIDINQTITLTRNLKDNLWIGIFQPEGIAEFELLEK